MAHPTHNGLPSGTAKESTADSTEEIAIIGLACRFPGASNVAEFWENLKHGVNARREFSDADLLAAGVSPAVFQAPGYVKAGYVLDGIEQFDADFFGFSPRQAQLTDPQQRLFLECAWEALENAGIDVVGNDQIIGVYAGAAMNHYALQFRDALAALDSSANHLQWLIANDKDYLAMQTAYKLNLRGPCINAQTACSTGLVLVHMACQSLLNYECDVAMAGSVTVPVPQMAGYFYQENGIFSPDGYCRAFDATGQGTAFGSGLGIVVLKRVQDAVADGDHIWAIIKGSAVNNDGAHKVGFTAPTVEGQARVIAEAQAVAGITPATIRYIEAQGTATPIGDAMEFEALDSVFTASQVRPGSCAVGAVKTNIGHLQVASGIAGLIKTVLALYHRAIPPSLNFAVPNPRIQFAGSPFYINTQLTAWTADQAPRRAGVTAYGIGGTNAHIVLEEAPASAEIGQAGEPPCCLLTLSAKTADALRTLVERYIDYLATVQEISLADICYTSYVGRSHFAHRLSIVGASHAQVQAKLAAYLQGEAVAGVSHGVLSHDHPVQGYPASHTPNDLPDCPQDGLAQVQKLERLGLFYVQGGKLDWSTVDPISARRKTPLPTYPFQRQRYWVDASPAQSAAPAPSILTPGQGGKVNDEWPALRQQLADSISEDWPALLLQYLQRATARILAVRNPSQIDPTRNLLQQGLDSLMALELRNQIKEALPALALPLTVFVDTSIQQLAVLLEEQLLHGQLSEARSASAEIALSPASAAISAISGEISSEDMVEEFIL